MYLLTHSREETLFKGVYRVGLAYNGLNIYSINGHACMADFKSICVSEDMSPYCSAHYEWLIMKLCMHVGYHDASNVSTFSGDTKTQLNLKKVLNI